MRRKRLSAEFLNKVSVKMMEMNDTELLPSPFGFERRFDERGAIRWMQENW